MKKKLNLLLISLCAVLISCQNNNSEISSSTQSEKPSEVPPVEELKYDKVLDEDYSNIKKLSELEKSHPDDLMYDDEVFGIFNERRSQQLYFNNKLDNEMYDGMVKETDDGKYLFYSDDTMRFVNRADGYAFNYKTENTFNGDFALSKYYSKLYNTDETISVSVETKNPYDEWWRFRDEWLFRYINNPEFIKDNNLAYYDDVIFEKTNVLKGHAVSIFPIEIKDPGEYRKCFYNIAAIRDEYDFAGKKFYFIVMKSTTNRHKEFIDLVKSFEEIEAKGLGYNAYLDMPIIEPEIWSDETRKYYHQLIEQERTGWGIFTNGIDEAGKVKAKLSELSTAMDYNFDILPTYKHVIWGVRNQPFPTAQAKQLAGGNGFNNKMVLQYSYQYTNNNNNVSVENTTDCYTPMFDILRGKPEEYDLMGKQSQIYRSFELMVEGLKEYSAPVLFRLNNEMNSDWVSYCGLMCLNDTDIFKATWRILYNYLIDNGVDNTIWIFNPVPHSIPYGSWGEDMCYFPGNNYVQALGLTYYQSNNDNDVHDQTFRENYTELYEKNNPTWNKYPWIISEFGCGSGGAASGVMYRNQESQARYVAGMFSDFANRSNNPYLQNIKGAVWFGVNDSEASKPANVYELVISKIPLTIEEFRKGLANNK